MFEKHKGICWVLVTIIFIEMMDVSVINTSFPQIAMSLGVEPLRLKLALTAYLLSLGVFIPTSGWFAERFGERVALFGAVLVFMIGSILSSCAWNLWSLVLSRILQGAGGALLSPVGRLILFKLFEKREIVGVLSQIVTISLVGPLLGPFVGGFLTTYVSWRAIFWINIPICLGVLFAILIWLPKLPKSLISKPFDWKGFLWLTLGVSLLLFACQEIVDKGLGREYVFLVVGVLFVCLYLRHAKRVPHPVLSLKIFRQRIFRLCISTGILSRMSLVATPFMLPLLFQLGYGLSALQAATYLCFVGFGILSMKPFVKRLLARFTFRRVLLWNSCFLTLSNWSLIALCYHPHWLLTVTLLLIYGWVSSLQFSAVNLLAFAEVRKHLTAQTNSAYIAFHQVIAGFGIALMALILEISAGSHDLMHAIPLAAFWKTFAVMGLFSLSACLGYRKLRPQDGSNLH